MIQKRIPVELYKAKLTGSKSSQDALIANGDAEEAHNLWLCFWDFPFLPLQPHFLCRDNPLWLPEPDPDPEHDPDDELFALSDSIIVSRVSIERTPVDCWSVLTLSDLVLEFVKSPSQLCIPSTLGFPYCTVLDTLIATFM